jgi:hypothetical protein
MLHIDYCPKDNCEFSWEEERCETCIFYAHYVGYFGCDWFGCSYALPLEKEEYIALLERLEMGL